MHTETKHTAIPARVKAAVAKRDSTHGPATCIICGAPGGPCCHVVRRSQGGCGDTERNIVSLCNRCHMAYDEGLFLKQLKPIGFESQEDIREYIYDYMRGIYPEWEPESVKYHKYGDRKEEP